MSSDLEHLSRLLEETGRDPLAQRGDADTMFDTEEHYRSVGISALRAVRIALLSARVDRVERILDFACGHGRVLRWLAAAFPDAALVAADVDEDGVDYCATEFGATKVVSNPAMRDVVLPGPFDLCWVGSLLTHLDAQGWQRFLELVLPQMQRGGLLIFTTHGRVVERNMRGGEAYLLDAGEIPAMLAEHDATGFAYRDYPHQPGYGVSLSAAHWVTEHILEVGALRIVHFAEGVWDGHQDVFACQRI